MQIKNIYTHTHSHANTFILVLALHMCVCMYVCKYILMHFLSFCHKLLASNCDIINNLALLQPFVCCCCCCCIIYSCFLQHIHVNAVNNMKINIMQYVWQQVPAMILKLKKINGSIWKCRERERERGRHC